MYQQEYYRNNMSNNGQYYPRNGNRNRYKQGTRKRSGATNGFFHDKKKDKKVPYIRGWRATKGGVITYFAKEYKNTHRWDSKGKSGFEYENWMVNITNETTGETQTTTGFHNVQKGTIYMDSGIYINPKAPNGGYTGNVKQAQYRQKKRY